MDTYPEKFLGGKIIITNKDCIDVECELLSKEDVEKYIKSRDIEKASHGRIPNI